MTPTAETSTKTPALLRELGVAQASAIVVGTIIGSGIFLVPADMMQAVGSARLVYLAWIVGGMLSMAGAITYAELGAMKPQAGGEYVYIRDAYGPLPAFLYAWTWFVVAKPGSVATIATGIVRILGTFSALAFFNDPVLPAPLPVTYGRRVRGIYGCEWNVAQLRYPLPGSDWGHRGVHGRAGGGAVGLRRLE
jgi:APA family basic amino acid/polyamine antiporter